MIYCNRFSNMGRLGNHIMRLMTIISFAKKYNTNYYIPHWPYAKYFDSEIPQKVIQGYQTIKEAAFHYTPEYWDKVNFNKRINLYGWFQSYKYWDKEEVKKVLKFKEEFLDDLTDSGLHYMLKNMVAVSVRRGDFVGNQNYYQLPLEYYTGSLETHFPGREVLVFSDDIEWCKNNFIGSKYRFAGGTDIEQLALMTQCSDYVISNSTFSFCGAYLSQNKNAKVIRPKYNLAGPLANKKSEADYWPPEWIVYDFEKTRAAVIVYHKNISKIYPPEWVDRFRDSIREQTFKNYDILELNYGGTEERIFEESKFESIEVPTFAHAMNYLLDKCKEYDCVFNTNADDWFSPDRFESQIRFINEGYDIVSSNFSLVKDDQVTLTHQFEKRNIKEELKKDHNVICHPVVAYSKKFVENERYDPELIPFEDMKLWQQTIDKYKYIILPEVLCFHRLHNNSVGHNLKEMA